MALEATACLTLVGVPGMELSESLELSMSSLDEASLASWPSLLDSEPRVFLVSARTLVASSSELSRSSRSCPPRPCRPRSCTPIKSLG